MWVGIDEDLRVGTEATEDTEDLLHASTLLASRIELTVREGTRTAFAKAIVRLGVDDARLLQLDEVTTALHHILPTLYDDGTHAQLDEPERSEEPARPSTDDDCRRRRRDIGIDEVGEVIHGRLLAIEIDVDGEVDEDTALTSIDIATAHHDRGDGLQWQGELTRHDLAQRSIRRRLIGTQRKREGGHRKTG
jgi:hypothetical protein